MNKYFLTLLMVLCLPLSLYPLPDQGSLDVAELESFISVLNVARTENKMLAEKTTEILDAAEEAMDKAEYFKFIDAILESCLYFLGRIKHHAAEAMETVGIEKSEVVEVVNVLLDRKEASELAE